MASAPPSHMPGSGSPAAAHSLRCSAYFVHVPGATPMDGLWVAPRAARWRRPVLPSWMGPAATLSKLPASREAAGARAGGSGEAQLIMGSYVDLQAHKPAVLRHASAAGAAVGAERDWHVHHLVEGDLYADMHVEEVPYQWMYQHVLPCVLVHKHEHDRYFHSVTRSGANRELYDVPTRRAGRAPPEERAQMTREAFHHARASKDAAALAALAATVQRRETMLVDLHDHDATLAAVVLAVFRRIRARLAEAGHRW